MQYIQCAVCCKNAKDKPYDIPTVLGTVATLRILCEHQFRPFAMHMHFYFTWHFAFSLVYSRHVFIFLYSGNTYRFLWFLYLFSKRTFSMTILFQMESIYFIICFSLNKTQIFFNSIHSKYAWVEVLFLLIDA